MDVSFELLVVAVASLIGLSMIFTAWCATLHVRVNRLRRQMHHPLGQKLPVRSLSDIGR